MFILSKIRRVSGLFLTQKLWLQIALLFVPFVNWFIELCVRWSIFSYRKSFFSFLVAVIATLPTSIFLGWLDLVWLIMTKNMVSVKIVRNL